MKYVLLYVSADDVARRAAPHFAAHKSRLDAFHDRGDLLMVGLFGDPQTQGSMAVFRTRAAAEEFVADDPFVTQGVVRSYEIRDWNEIYSG